MRIQSESKLTTNSTGNCDQPKSWLVFCLDLIDVSFLNQSSGEIKQNQINLGMHTTLDLKLL